ncbi:MAG: hypothetical protein ACK4NA_07725 [Alphaproteobacteria bacterium]
MPPPRVPPRPKPPATPKNSLKRPRNAEKGGLETRPSQPLGDAPLRESYGASSGETAPRAATPRRLASPAGKK